MATPNPPDLRDAAEDEQPSRMSFFEHLVELRVRLIHSLIGIFGGVCVGLVFSDRVRDLILRPMHHALQAAKLTDRLVYLSPMTPIKIYITVGLYLGVVIASPWVFYQVWLFVAPGLYKHERRAAVMFIISSVGLFLSGVAFGYFVMLPMSLKFLLSIAPPDAYSPMLTMDGSIDLILLILAGLGVVFQLPILIFFLTLFGIVTPKFLWKNFRYAILIIAIIAAIVTPTTDALTMAVFMAPMVVLYFVGLGVSAMVVRKRRARALAREGAR
jgi:sec-independent protein translocase protein TatC